MKSLFAVLLLATVANAAWDYSYALHSLYYSYGAYCEPAALKSWTCKWCKNNPGFTTQAVITNSQYDSQVYVGFDSTSNTIVVAYRGTSNLENWIENLKTWKSKSPFPGAPGSAEVHAGFLQIYKGSITEVETAFNAVSSAHPGAAVLVTGHSLGAALAELTVAEMASGTRFNNYTKHDGTLSGPEGFRPNLVDFGCPRTGNKAYAEWFERIYGAQSVRVTNHHDIVPHLPPEAFGFFHTTTEVWENGATYKSCSTTNGEDPTCADSVALPDSIYDHLHYMQIHESCQ